MLLCIEKVFDFQQECKQNSNCLFFLKCMEVEVWKLHKKRRKKIFFFEEGKSFIFIVAET